MTRSGQTGREVRSHRPGGPVTQTDISSALRVKRSSAVQCRRLATRARMGLRGARCWSLPQPPPASPTPEEASADHSAPLNGSTEAINARLREAAQAIGQDLSDADLAKAIARAAKESGTAKTIQAANEVLAKARKGEIKKSMGRWYRSRAT